MTPHCRKCRRPLRLPSPDGLGPVCRRRAAIPTVDLFTPRLDAAEASARTVVREVIETAALKARMAIRHAYVAALGRVAL